MRAARSGRRRAAAAWLAALAPLLAAPSGAAAAVRAIPPGQEPLVSEMVGGAALPGGCRAERIDIAPDRIAALFRCDTGEARLQLLHPDDAPAGVLRTDRFALVPVGTVPPGLAEAVAAGVRRHEDRFLWRGSEPAGGAPVAAGEPAPPPLSWLLPAAAVLALAGLFGSPRPGARDLGAALALAAGSSALRLALGPFGPFRMNGLGPMWIASAVGSGDASAYGPGYAEVFGPLAAAFPAAPDTAIFAANAVLSGLLPALAFGLGRLVGLSGAAALAAALVMAADPVAIRTGATETYFGPIAALTLGASVLFLAAARALPERERWPSACLAGAAALLLAQAARIHPVALAPVVLAPVAVVALPGEGTWKRLGLAGGMAAAAVALTSAGVLLRVAGALRAGELMSPALGLPWVAAGASAAALLLAAARATRRRLHLAAAPHVALALATSINYQQGWLWHQAYLRPFVPVPLVAAASLLPPPAALPLAAAASAGLLAAGWPVVRGRTTDHLEYRWARAALASVPEDCTVAWVWSAGSRALALPARREFRITAGEEIPAALLRERCLYYLHGSLCSSAEGRPACELVERSLSLAPVSRASFPAHPSARQLPYDRPTVECALFRVLGPAGAGSPP